MSNHQSPEQKSLSAADKLERKLAKIIAADKRKMKNENIVRRNKNGDLTYETVRTFRVPHSTPHAPREDSISRSEMPTMPQHDSHSASEESLLQNDSSENPVNSNSLPNKLPETPIAQENGNQSGGSATNSPHDVELAVMAQSSEAVAVTPTDTTATALEPGLPDAPISCHEAGNAGNQVGQAFLPANQTGRQECLPHDEDRDPLDDLLRRALAAVKVRRGRPPALDDQAKGQLIALLSVGMSMRQAAAVLGVSHTTIQKVLKADPSLGEDITAARFQAQLQPLACVIREARRSWKAATWLLKYLDGKIATHEETPDERRQRQKQETDEFFGRSR